MTSKDPKVELCSLSFRTTPDYKNNLDTLIKLAQETKKNSLVVAHEVCLTGFDYENIDRACDFSLVSHEYLKQASKNKTIILTMLEKKADGVYNMGKMYHHGEIIHERAKARLFHLGDEHKNMSEGKDEDFNIVDINGIKVSMLICFELRFIELWKLVEGSDVIVIPSWWGAARAEHYKALVHALAIINQCYVIATDALNDSCSKYSAVISPNGIVHEIFDSSSIKVQYKKREIALTRRYIDTNITK